MTSNASAILAPAGTTSHSRRLTWTVIVAITLLGACLRVAAARGDLWLDEIWTFRLLETVRRPSDIVFALPNDNNHVLTTLWLWLVGPQAPPLLVRLQAIVLGTLCAPVAASVFGRRGAIPAMAAAMVFACDYAFVHFGSEARGYSGLILAALVAFGAMDAMLSDAITPRRQVVFALAVAFGTFSHLTMVEITGVLCAWGATTLTIRHGWRGSVDAIASIGLPALAGSLPPLVCVAVSLASGPLHTGFLTPFTGSAFVTGLSRMAGATLGLSDIYPGEGLIDVVLFAGLLGVIAARAFVLPQRRTFYAIAFLGVPVLHVVLRLPNQQYPRFHLIVSIAIALLCVDVWSLAWLRMRPLAITTAGVFLLAQALALSRFLDTGRGHFAEAVATMQAQGPATFAVDPEILAGETRAVVRWYAGPSLKPASDITCAALPDWLIVATVLYEHPDIAAERSFGPPDCPTRYPRAARYPAYGLSGFVWTLYRRP